MVYTDVTEMKRREAELAQNTKRLEIALEKEVELSSMKSNFVATASREFRTPLTITASAFPSMKLTAFSTPFSGLKIHPPSAVPGLA